MRKLKVLELFSGTRSISKAFERHGHKTFCVDWNEDFQADLHMDIEKLTADMVLSNFGRPDVCWVSSDCATYSVQAISKHRRKNKETGNLDPISDKAMKADRTNLHVIRLLVELSPPANLLGESEGWSTEDGVHGMDAEVHGELLPVPEGASHRA